MVRKGTKGAGADRGGAERARVTPGQSGQGSREVSGETERTF